MSRTVITQRYKCRIQAMIPALREIGIEPAAFEVIPNGKIIEFISGEGSVATKVFARLKHVFIGTRSDIGFVPVEGGCYEVVMSSQDSFTAVGQKFMLRENGGTGEFNRICAKHDALEKAKKMIPQGHRVETCETQKDGRIRIEITVED